MCIYKELCNFLHGSGELQRTEEKTTSGETELSRDAAQFLTKQNNPHKLTELLCVQVVQLRSTYWEPPVIWLVKRRWEDKVNLALSDCITALMLSKPHLLSLLPHAAAGWQAMVVITLAPCPLRSVVDYACLGSLLQQTQTVETSLLGSCCFLSFSFCMLWFVFLTSPS